MDPCRDLFADKRITLMGLGLLGRGAGDAEFLAKCGAHVFVTDKKPEAELAEPVALLRKYPNVEFRLGGHRIEDFTNADAVVKAAGVPLDSPEIVAARDAGIPVYMSTALFAKFAIDEGAKVVGITGTRGKSTVAHMVFHVLQKAGKRSHLGGNVRGKSTLAMLPDVEAGDIAVLELDSWQLQGFSDLKISPNVSVFTNLMPDHQNYYPGMDAYFSDKANIFRFQKEGDALFVGASVLGRVEAAGPPVPPVVPPALPTEWMLKVIGEHNRENASLAAAALRALGLSDDEIRKGIESFEGVEGRLQFVREVNGIRIYNDNNATTPEATVAALRALGGNATVIIGGSEKGLPLEELVSEMKKNVSHIVLLMHPNYKGSLRLAEMLKGEGVRFEEATDLRQALTAAVKATRSGNILFSPAFASFGMFKNEYERNDQFLSLARELG